MKEPKTLRIGNLTLAKGAPGFADAWTASINALGVFAIISRAIDGTYFGCVDVGRYSLARAYDRKTAQGVRASLARQMHGMAAAVGAAMGPIAPPPQMGIDPKKDPMIRFTNGRPQEATPTPADQGAV